LPALYDEPFADSSQVPTFLVSQMTRQHVTVSLSGDGGDELFGGYERYFIAPRVWKKFAWAPGGCRRPIGGILFRSVSRTAGRRLTRKVRTLAEILTIPDAMGIYRVLLTHWKAPTGVVIGGGLPATEFTAERRWHGRQSFLEQMMCLDTVTYLPDD